MNRFTTITVLRRGAILVLALGLGLGAWHLAANGAEPQSTFDDSGTLLARRVEIYQDLRRKDDFVPLYDMLSPDQRAQLPLVRFLEYFGHGMLRIQHLEVVHTAIDAELRRAVVTFRQEAEVDLVRAPPQFRNARIESSEDLRVVNDKLEIPWVWKDGAWYWEVEDVFVTGIDPTGRPIQPGSTQK